MENKDLRRFARANEVPLWKIANALDISEPTLTRRLREELADDKKAEIYAIIERLAKAVG